jgi:two-component system NarL family response regulator
VILIASSSSDMLATWEQGLQGFNVVLTVRRLGSLREGLVRVVPQVLLLDFDLPGLDGPKGVAGLRKANPATKIIVLTGVVSDEMELALFKAGAQGCCRSDIDPQLLKRVVVAVQQGELWIRRSITPRLLDELGARLRDEARTTHIVAGLLADLTLREREIAELIGNGESNKQIARRLFITERTVKAHLTGIFRKLGIGDRLSLALRVSGRREADGEYVN